MIRPVKHPKSQVYRIRKGIPAPLRHLFGGKSELIESLGTKDPAEAKRLAPGVITRIEALIAGAGLRSRGDGVPLSDRRVAELAGVYYREGAAAVESEPGAAEDAERAVELLEDEAEPTDLGHNLDDGGHWRPEFVPGRSDLAEAAARAAAGGLSPDHASVRRIAVELFYARVALARLRLRRARGDWSRDGYADRFPPAGGAQGVPSESQGPSAPAMPARKLLDAWATERQPAPATLRRYRTAFAHVARILGFDDLRRVRPEDVVTFKGRRLAERISVETVADDVMGCGAVCKWGVQNKHLLMNPFASMAPRPAKRGETARDGFTDDEAAAILQAARGATGWRRWLPWLLCFTGARISEIVELRRKDVRQEAGVWILDIRPTAARAGKNATFQRMLPLHPSVIEEGFLAYVGVLPIGGDGSLFPDLTVARDGTRTVAATSALGRWVRRDLGITNPRKAPAHSWRHRMEDELRKARVTEEAQDAITGRHNPRNAGAGYGKGYRGMPDEVLKELRKVPSPLAVRDQARAAPAMPQEAHQPSTH
ncbi:DUF6538 domain-containing protein [Siccirubricoccus deserti]|uniref:Tyrosine-type recombinase/integrase n=1 Tax=Siccirubricoccus deserti TaxID=2013562 RepID=A0A9X0QZJ1_9PROT|nr:DUF6538 domain-containing protein [Siccirubricoccus deserti]MBC4015783.1 tyrosine-type recombinase/integrase [Siccirubricoccus deserti]